MVCLTIVEGINKLASNQKVVINWGYNTDATVQFVKEVSQPREFGR
jgi:hypothetical protein